jgi:hypothetical protein
VCSSSIITLESVMIFHRFEVETSVVFNFIPRITSTLRLYEIQKSGLILIFCEAARGHVTCRTWNDIETAWSLYLTFSFTVVTNEPLKSGIWKMLSRYAVNFSTNYIWNFFIHEKFQTWQLYETFNLWQIYPKLIRILLLQVSAINW